MSFVRRKVLLVSLGLLLIKLKLSVLTKFDLKVELSVLSVDQYQLGNSRCDVTIEDRLKGENNVKQMLKVYFVGKPGSLGRGKFGFTLSSN